MYGIHPPYSSSTRLYSRDAFMYDVQYNTILVDYKKKIIMHKLELFVSYNAWKMFGFGTQCSGSLWPWTQTSRFVFDSFTEPKPRTLCSVRVRTLFAMFGTGPWPVYLSLERETFWRFYHVVRRAHWAIRQSWHFSLLFSDTESPFQKKESLRI